MTSTLWLSIPPQRVRLADLVFAQTHVAIEGLLRQERVDPYPHVICYRDRLYLDDGHCRATLALLRGDEEIEARVLPLD